MLSTAEKNCQSRGFRTPPPKWQSNRWRPMMPRSERGPRRSVNESDAKADLFHVIHKIPAGDSPYVRAKHVQLVEKDPSRAISLFWAAINSGDRVDSALKDMAVVMKQMNRSDEAIEAIKSFRNLCPLESQESLDNVLLELYKSSGRIEEEIQMLQAKLKHIEEGNAFGGKRTKQARSQGKKVQITVEKEYSRLLGNLAWAYLQQSDYKSAEEIYRRALSLEPDKNKQCNLAICLMHSNKVTEAKFLLQIVKASFENGMEESCGRSFERATQIFDEIESQKISKPIEQEGVEYGEVRTPFSSTMKRNYEGLRIPANGDQNDPTVTGVFKRLASVQQDEMEPFAEWNRGSQNCCDSKNDVSSSNAGRFKGTSSGRRMDENWLCNHIKESSSAWKKSCGSPFSVAGTPTVPFTQPRKFLWSGLNGDQRLLRFAEEPIVGCNRKLLFHEHVYHERVNNQNLDHFIADRATKEPEKLGASASEERIKTTMDGLAKAKSGSSMNLISVGEWEDDEQKKSSTKDDGYCPLESVGGESAGLKFSNTDFEEHFTSITADNVRLVEAAENAIQIIKSNQKLTTERDHMLEFSASRSGKSWADMVEEDEQGFLNETNCYPVPEREFPSKEPFLLHETPNRYSDDWEAGEEFVDENKNSNIILETPSSLNQCESLSQKVESLGLRDGYYTQPPHGASLMNPLARRALSFEYQNQGTEEHCFSSPLQKKALDFLTNNPVPVKEDPGQGPKLMTRKSRLQVFQDITPESPRC